MSIHDGSAFSNLRSDSSTARAMSISMIAEAMPVATSGFAVLRRFKSQRNNFMGLQCSTQSAPEAPGWSRVEGIQFVPTRFNAGAYARMPRRANSNQSPEPTLPGRSAYAGLLLLVSFFWPACSPGSQAQTAVAPDTDRWLEIDLYWFKQQAIAPSARQFWDRFEPLYRGVSGYRGVILNIGWTVGPGDGVVRQS